jgi:alkylhydroperoxidase family enzyme
MRLPYAVPCESSPVVQAIRRRRGGQVNQLDKALLHSPTIAAAWNVFIGAVHSQTPLIRDDVRELIILRVAALNSAWAQWLAHYPMAIDVGVEPTLLEMVKKGKEWDLSGMQNLALGTMRWTLLRYVDCMTVDVAVPDEVFDDLHLWWSEQQVVELTTMVAAYNMMSRFLVALDVGEMNGKEPPVP